MAIFDSHAHLADKKFIDDLTDIIERARTSNVDRIMVVADNMDTAYGAVRLSLEFDGLYPTAGIHPYYAQTTTKKDREALRKFIRIQCGVLKAIGEIGLDFYYGKDTIEEQISLFTFQLELAVEFKLPVVIHCRDAENETLDILSRFRQVTGVFHCFTGDAVFCQRVVMMGYYVSFSGIVTFKNADAIRCSAQIVPVDKILIETDSPYLAPQGFRGKRNEPSFITSTLKKLAQLRDIPQEELAKNMYRNTMNLFSIEE